MNFLLVMIGGAAGSALRYGMQLMFASSDGGFPFTTLAINIIGSFAVGMIAALVPLNLVSRDLALLLGVGFCGGFTTFSTFSAETLYLMQSDKVWLAILYAAISVVGGGLAAWLGWTLFDRS